MPDEVTKHGSRLRRPPEAGYLRRQFSHTFKTGTQVANAEAVVVVNPDEAHEYSNKISRRQAEGTARMAADHKYHEHYGVEVDWPAAQVVVIHSTYAVEVFIYVEGI